MHALLKSNLTKNILSKELIHITKTGIENKIKILKDGFL